MSRPIRRNEAEKALKVLENTRKRINGYRVINRRNLRKIIRDRVASNTYQPLLASFISGKITDWFLQQNCPFGHGPEVDRLTSMIERLREAIRRKRRNEWPSLSEVTNAKREAKAYGVTLREGFQRTGKDLPIYAQMNLEWFEDTIAQVIEEWEGKTEDEREVMWAEEMILSNHQRNEYRQKKIVELQAQIAATDAENETLRERIKRLQKSS